MKKIALLVTVLMVVLGMAASCPAAGRGKLYVIGLGPAGPQTATMQALQTIKRMDALVTRPRHLKPFAKYIKDTPVWFDHLSGLWDYGGVFFTKLDAAGLKKFKAERARMTKQRLARIDALLAKGKNLGMLEGGNPCVFSSSHWYIERMNPADVVIIPGMGSAAAAMAALGKSAIPAYGSRFLLQTAPFVLAGDGMSLGQAFAGLAKFQPTMVFYMAVKHQAELFAQLRSAFPADTPCAVVFWAGYPDKQRVIKGTITSMPAMLAGDKDRYMGILLVGNFLEGNAYLTAEDKP
jgi:precorrin-4/cobalt-precorrin-4 C11-methyltransferase